MIETQRAYEVNSKMISADRRDAQICQPEPLRPRHELLAGLARRSRSPSPRSRSRRARQGAIPAGKTQPSRFRRHASARRRPPPRRRTARSSRPTTAMPRCTGRARAPRRRSADDRAGRADQRVQVGELQARPRRRLRPDPADAPARFACSIRPTPSISGNRNFNGTGTADQANALSGEVTVTVAEVYPNGTMLVQGQKRVTLNRGDEWVQIHGHRPHRRHRPRQPRALDPRRRCAHHLYRQGRRRPRRAARAGCSRFFQIVSPVLRPEPHDPHHASPSSPPALAAPPRRGASGCKDLGALPAASAPTS